MVVVGGGCDNVRRSKAGVRESAAEHGDLWRRSRDATKKAITQASNALAAVLTLQGYQIITQ